jgi:uridine kinase
MCNVLFATVPMIVIMEGNFPFLYPELADLIDIKTVYLTSDETRLKRKWRRDMDFRKKYDLNYFRNRYFREQMIMAQDVYIPQMLKCDFVVDTSSARLWVGPQMKKNLDKNHKSELVFP